MRIGIDVDSVVAEIMPHLLKRINAKFKTHYVKSDIVEWNFVAPEFELYPEVLEALSDPEFVLSMEPVKGSVDGVRKLRALGFEIMFVTSRNYQTIDATRLWIDRYFGDDIPIRHTHNGRKNGFDILIDDYHKNVECVLNSEKEVAILLDQPWNHNEKIVSERITRCYNWDEILKTIERLVE